MRTALSLAAGVLLVTCGIAAAAEPTPSYPIVDTGQQRCYDDRQEIAYPQPGQPFFGQDAQYAGKAPAYRDNRDGTVTDLVTGLMWQADPGEKKTFAQAVEGAARCRAGGHSDWRLPTIKELYSLIQFSGTDPDPRSTNTARQRPFIDARYFKFRYGDPAEGDRIIDSQWATSTRYVSTTMRGDPTMFGVNFADGRIKGYPIMDPRRRTEKLFYVIYVRGNTAYGKNDFVDNGDGTITDRATGLTWMQVDSGHLKAGKAGDGRLNWQEALAWAEGLSYAGRDDWRLPNIKELQSLVDYSRAPAKTGSPAIDPAFKTTPIMIEGGRKDYPFYWSGTTHASLHSGGQAAYVALGTSPGFMRDPRTGSTNLLDVHGAGSQRSDPKLGDPSRYAEGRGPQGDVVRIYNFARCVRGGAAAPQTVGPELEASAEQPPGRKPAADEDLGERPRGGPPDRPRASMELGGFVERLDRNADGKVSREEFDGPRDRFGDFDRNRDGYVTEDEARAVAPPPPSARR
ncbi:MAG: DUF1566 domain-containing protein [Planctomycetota bacterium]